MCEQINNITEGIKEAIKLKEIMMRISPIMELPTDERIQYHKWLKDDEIKIKLMKMSKGYQWELTCEGIDDEAVIKRMNEVDAKLRQLYEKAEE